MAGDDPSVRFQTNLASQIRASSFPQPYPGAAAVLRDKLDTGRFERSAHLIDTADASILTSFKAIYGIPSNAGCFGEIERAPIEGCAPHTALNWLHVVFLSPKSIDSNLVMALPIMV
ncbi:hypothetical protein [Mesorhizobium delmotii]|uniref:hypothetical protein n=1 Tax=Mesorhizobium delmotii TaxID=1631247 RepID=UPI001401C549